MEVFEGHRALARALRAPTVAIGNFDGVHVGHRQLFATARKLAAEHGGDAVAFTFAPHPASVLAPNLAPALITPRPRKLELIAESGIDVCVVEPFTRELASLPPDEFLDRIVVDALGARHVVVGYDFSYGCRRAGTIATLQAHGERCGFGVHVVQPVTADGLVASSTKVRSFADHGKLDGIRRLLARDLDVDGEVVRGAGRGRTIGVPTANIRPAPEQLLPRPGVYAVRVQRLAESPPRTWHPAVANLGTNPTFVEEGATSLEVHLLDYQGDLYGQRLRIAFVHRLRGERRFDSVDGLIAQIRADADEARARLATEETAGREER